MRRRPADVGLNLLGQPELSEQLMRALALKGDLPQMLDPVFQLAIRALDLELPEYQYLRRLGRWAAGFPTGAGVGLFSYFVFAARTLSRTLAVVEKILINNPQAGAATFYVYLTQNGAGPGGGTLSIPADDRLNGGDLTSLGNFSVGVNTVAGDFHPADATIITVPPTSCFVLDAPYVLSGQRVGGNPTMLYVQAASLNLDFHGSIYWRERSMLDTEL